MIAAGDSLYFRKCFPEYPAGQGYSLLYELVTAAGAPALSFTSTASGNDHLVEIDNFAATLDTSADYLLVGYVVNPAGVGGGTERHEIYRGFLLLTPNLASGVPVPNQEPIEKRYVKLLREGLERLYTNELQETDIERTKVIRVKRAELRMELNFWEERLAWKLNEIAVRNGRPNGNEVRNVYQIM